MNFLQVGASLDVYELRERLDQSALVPLPFAHHLFLSVEEREWT